MVKAKDTKKQKKEIKKKESFFKGVKQELKKVKWPDKKEVVKYTVSTILFIIFLVGFFLLLSLLMSFVKGVFA